MKNIKIASAQFENRSGDKNYNLSVIDRLSQKAAQAGADAIAFHECSVTGYSFARKLNPIRCWRSRKPFLMEKASDACNPSPKMTSLSWPASLEKMPWMIFTKPMYVWIKPGFWQNTANCIPLLTNISYPEIPIPYLNLEDGNAGSSFVMTTTSPKTYGPPNHADIIFMPHVTMCTPSTRPGAGFVDPAKWVNRETDPTSLRMEFDGLKGRSWLMKWLPARAYDNSVYAIFSNPIGMDHDQLKNGCSMIIDPFGDILDECRSFSDEFVIATCTPEKLKLAGGYRYLKARRPELYREIIGQPHVSEQKVSWLD